MRSGFTLIELLVALAFGGIIGAVLFTSLFQFNKGAQIADQIISTDSKAAIVQNQLDRDISGMFTPYFFSKKKDGDEKKAPEKTKEKEQGDQKKKPDKKKNEENPFEPLENAFFMQEKDGMVNLFSFVTSNPLLLYGKMTPRVVRVVYRLVPERPARDGQSSFALYRQELKELEFKPEDEVKRQGVLVVDGVKNLKMEFEARVIPKTNEVSSSDKASGGREAAKKEPPKITYEKANFWGPEQIKKFNKQLPNFVKTTWSFWDGLKKKTRTFNFLSVVMTDDAPPTMLKKERARSTPVSDKNVLKPKPIQANVKTSKNKNSKNMINLFAGGIAIQKKHMDKDSVVIDSKSPSVKKIVAQERDYCEVPV